MKKNKKILIKIIKILISFFLIAYLLYSIEWNIFLSVVANANLLYIIFAGLLYFSGILFSVFRWDIMLKMLGIHITKTLNIRLYLESSFMGNFLPTSIGGDVYKYAILSKQLPNKKQKIIGSMLLERGFGFLMLFAINIITLPFFLNIIFSNKKLMLLEMIVFGGGITFFLLFNKGILNLLNRLFVNFSLYKKIYEFLVSLRKLFNLKNFLLPSMYSLFFILNILLGQILYLMAFGVFINPLYILFSISITYIAGILPISFNSIGITEGLTVFLYGLAGISPETALAVALSGRVCLIFANLSGGLWLLFPRALANPIK